MIPMGSPVIIVEANEPGDLVPASVTWQLVGTQEPSSGKKVSRCSKTAGWAWVGGTQPWHGATICILEGIVVSISQVSLSVVPCRGLLVASCRFRHKLSSPGGVCKCPTAGRSD